MEKVSVIVVTDLYHPHQDPGDNFDLIFPYAVPNVELKAVILDCTNRYRQPYADHEEAFFKDPTGPRDPGFIPVIQLNSIFNRNVPVSVGPYTPMKSTNDLMTDVPNFQQQGIELILNTLDSHEGLVEIVSFGSTRTIAAAFNRNPELMRKKVRKIHISAGASSPHYLEWNVQLDVNAFVSLLNSDLPIDLYPCATHEGPFAYGKNNSFWRLDNLKFIGDMHSSLRRYLAYSFERIERVDFLRAIESDIPIEHMERIYNKVHNVWETAVWAKVANLSLTKRNGYYQLIPRHEVLPSEKVLEEKLRPCVIDIKDDGMFKFNYTKELTNFRIYERPDPYENESAYREALPDLYRKFKP